MSIFKPSVTQSQYKPTTLFPQPNQQQPFQSTGQFQTSSYQQPAQGYQPQGQYSGSQRCSTHREEIIKRVCTSQGCNRKILLCAECSFEDPDHIKQHKDVMVSFNEFLQTIDNQYRSRANTGGRGNQNLPPQILDLAQRDEQYIQTLQTYLNTERRKVNLDYQAIQQVVKDCLELSLGQVQGELAHHYNSITQSLVDFKKVVQPSTQTQENPRQQVEQALRSYSDDNLLQAQLRSIRDKSFNGQSGSMLDSPGNLYKCTNLAESIKKSMAYPPTYTPIALELCQEFALQLKVVFDDFTQKLLDNISSPPIENNVASLDQFSDHAISQDGLSVRLPIKESLMLSYQPQILSTFHKDRINCIKTLDVPYLVSGGMDGLAMLYNVDNGELVTSFSGHKGPITCLGSFKSINQQTNQTQNFLVSGSTDQNVILWDLVDESNTLVFKGHEDTVTTIITLEDQQHIASGGADRKIIVWDIINSKISCVLPCNGSIYQLHKLKTGGGKSFFISCDYSQAMNIFKIDYSQVNKSSQSVANSKSIKVTLEKVILTTCMIYGITSSLSNPLLVVGAASDRSVKVWNFNYNQEDGKFSNEKIIKEFLGHKDGVVESIIVDTQNSSPGNEDYYIISCSLNDERILLKHSKSIQSQFYAHPGLKITEPFTSHKMQVTRNSRNEYKLIVVNQSPVNQHLLIWDLNDTRIL